MSEGKGEIILYQAEDGQTRIQVYMEDETVWLTQTQMSELFQRNKSTISEHISNVYEEGELERTSTLRKIALFQIEGDRHVKRDIIFYNLDMIISVGYRVNSRRGVQFRKWATQQLKEALLHSYHQTLELFRLLLAEPAATNHDKAGFVYLIRSVSGHYKIGCTKDPDHRLQLFSVKLPFEIEFIHIIATTNMFELERELHLKFHNKRINGEWFMLDEMEVEKIKRWEQQTQYGLNASQR